MTGRDIVAAFVVGLLIGSGEIFGGLCVGIFYNEFLRDEEDD